MKQKMEILWPARFKNKKTLTEYKGLAKNSGKIALEGPDGAWSILPEDFVLDKFYYLGPAD